MSKKTIRQICAELGLKANAHHAFSAEQAAVVEALWSAVEEAPRHSMDMELAADVGANHKSVQALEKRIKKLERDSKATTMELKSWADRAADQGEDDADV